MSDRFVPSGLGPHDFCFDGVGHVPAAVATDQQVAVNVGAIESTAHAAQVLDHHALTAYSSDLFHFYRAPGFLQSCAQFYGNVRVCGPRPLGHIGMKSSSREVVGDR